MRNLIYNVRKRFTTIAVSVTVGLLLGGGAVYAAETIDGHNIKEGTVSELKLGIALQERIDLIPFLQRGDSEFERRWQEADAVAIRDLREQIEAEYVHK